jgi:hypothetical protein
MPHTRWIHATRVASIAGLLAFAVVIVAAPTGGALESFFNVWVYNALMVLACVVAGSHAYLVPQERTPWAVVTLALASWTFGELWYAIFQPESYPSMADAGYIGFYPLLYVGIVLLLRSRTRSIAGTLWLDGLTAALAAAAIGAAVIVELVLESTEGSASTVVTNLS